MASAQQIQPQKRFTNILEDPKCIFDIPEWMDPSGIQLFLDEPNSDSETSDIDSDVGSDAYSDMSTESEDLSDTDVSDTDLSDLSSLPEQLGEFDVESDYSTSTSATDEGYTSSDDMSLSSIDVSKKHNQPKSTTFPKREPKKKDGKIERQHEILPDTLSVEGKVKQD